MRATSADERLSQREFDHASWRCRYCQERDTVLITLRQAGIVVCFCSACELGWCTDERGQPRD